MRIARSLKLYLDVRTLLSSLSVTNSGIEFTSYRLGVNVRGGNDCSTSAGLHTPLNQDALQSDKVIGCA